MTDTTQPAAAPAAADPNARFIPTLSKAVTVGSFMYKPGHRHSVNRAILDEMKAQGAVIDAKPDKPTG